jgi:hypothetical protein
MNGNIDTIAEAGQGFVDAVIHYLVDQLMEAFRSGIADIHGGTFPNGRQPLQYFNVIRVIGIHLSIL